MKFSHNPKFWNIYAICFSLNVAMVIVATGFQFGSRSVITSFNLVELTINRAIHVQRATAVRGYWEIFLPTVVVSVCILALMRLFPRLSSVALSRYVAGLCAVTLAPLWLWAIYIRAYGWSVFEIIQFGEIIVAACLAASYVSGKWRTPRLNILVLLLVHYSFWFWFSRDFFLALIRGWGGAFSMVPVVGLLSSVAWVSYVGHLPQGPPAKESLRIIR